MFDCENGGGVCTTFLTNEKNGLVPTELSRRHKALRLGQKTRRGNHAQKPNQVANLGHAVLFEVKAYTENLQRDLYEE